MEKQEMDIAPRNDAGDGTLQRASVTYNGGERETKTPMRSSQATLQGQKPDS